jgi:hypothetical protein
MIVERNIPAEKCAASWYLDFRREKKIPNESVVCKWYRRRVISTPRRVKCMPCTWIDPSVTYLMVS